MEEFSQNIYDCYSCFKYFIIVLPALILCLKGIVHPKMKIKSLITHPHAVPIP